nr:eukaryotic translation initiation factor 5B-like [Quercus suber]
MSDLRLLLKRRSNKVEVKGTGTSRPEANLPPPPPAPQVPDPALKPIPDLKKKRPMEPEDKEKGLPPKTKQQKVAKDRQKRESSVESREEPPLAEVRRGQRIWSPRLELDGAPFLWETSVRNFDGGRAGLIAEALQQPLLLPRDMESYRRFSQYELFKSLKRDLAMITQQVFVAEEWNRKTHVEAQAEAQARSEAERALDSLKGEISKLSEQLKGVSQERDSLDAGLKNAESQAESQRRQLSEAQKNLAAKRENTKALRAELLKAKKAAEEAQKDAQLAKEATEAEKRASFQLGVETTEKDLTEQFAAVARDYCDLTWGKALNAAGVPLDSTLRLLENIFYGEDIRQHPDDVPPVQLPEASELPSTEPNPSAILEPNQGLPLPGDQVSSTEPKQDKGEFLAEGKPSSDPPHEIPT